ncbi:hypothetical protein NQ318_015514 [Aromia moschata]|uniref:DUF4817 domain-containing protein n=1 Tax=Aromia moschata TaxID=1265417 RepID=A0AAV8XRE3_9CUCU|nr:hypothetical protein NQ318_015514 [Aromia moschata]
MGHNLNELGAAEPIKQFRGITARSVVGKAAARDLVKFRRVGGPISVANMVWTGVHQSFAVCAYFENNRFVIAKQRSFRRRFDIPRNNAVPNANTIRSWVQQLEETGTTLRRDKYGRRRSIRTQDNVHLVSAAIEQSPTRSVRRHAVALGISGRSLRRILHFDLNFHPYKIMMVQELSPADHSTCVFVILFGSLFLFGFGPHLAVAFLAGLRYILES